MRILLTFFFLLSSFLSVAQSRLTIVELNTENLFDTRHDTLKNDYEFLPDSPRHWTRTKYWQKLNRIGQTIIACGEDSSGWTLPDIVGLCEVENDSVLFDLTRRSLLRKARYEYVMTASNDARGIDVALLYSPELYSRPFRMHVMERLCSAIDSLRSAYTDPKLLVMGDFNDYADSPSLQRAYEYGLINISAGVHGRNGAKGTYRYHGEWGSLDQILGMRFNNGFSDHLPLVLRLQY